MHCGSIIHVLSDQRRRSRRHIGCHSQPVIDHLPPHLGSMCLKRGLLKISLSQTCKRQLLEVAEWS